jgi:type IV pilus assembly protein PilO
MAISRDSVHFNLDLNSVFESAQAQFRDLDPREPGQWPLLPKLGSWLAAGVATLAVLWVVFLMPAQDELSGERAREPELRQLYRDKLAQSVNLNELRKQKLQVEEYVNQLEKQLPSKAEMDALLADINQAAVGRGLQVELFRPGLVVVKDYYAEQPISVKVVGRFHDLGAFAADIASLSRIVTLHNQAIAVSARDGNQQNLSMEVLARTYRYLDASEQGKGGKKQGGGS